MNLDKLIEIINTTPYDTHRTEPDFVLVGMNIITKHIKNKHFGCVDNIAYYGGIEILDTITENEVETLARLGWFWDCEYECMYVNV